MPVITIAGNSTITLENKREMVKKVSEVVAEAYGLPVDAITVLVQGYNFDDIGVAGELLSDKQKYVFIIKGSITETPLKSSNQKRTLYLIA